MTWGLRRWLLVLAGASALSALVTLIVMSGIIILLQESYLSRTLDAALWQKYRQGDPLSSAEVAAIEATLEPYDSVWVLVAACLPSLAVAGVIGWLGSAPLLRHLSALRRTAQRVRAGDLAARVPEVRPTATEITGFARDFDALVARAERAERESRASAAVLAHELRTPLTVIRGRLQGMMDGVFAAGPDELALLMGQVDVLQRLMDDLRFLTLFDAGRMSFQKVPLRLDDILRDALAVHPAAEVALAPLALAGDRARLRQAVAAILDNAGRHAGGVDRVSLTRDGPDAVLEVADRGPGLTAAEARQVFDRFFRKAGTQPEGSGLGLAVVRAIALGHGGSVRARPRPGGGTILELRLPMAEEVVSTVPP